MNADSTEFWARWNNQGPFWREIFRLIDPAIAKFAETHGLQVSKWRWDAPDRTLNWEAKGVQRSLHVYLDPNEDEVSCVVNIEGSAWQDLWINGAGERSWHSERLGSIWHSRPLSESDDSLGESIVNALVEGFQAVQNWELDDLKETHHLSR